MSRARRAGGSLALLFLDIDDFKVFNDRFGHLAGDRVLREFSDLLRAVRRGMDIYARYGGDEFVGLLPETDLSGAQTVAKRIFERMKEQRFLDGEAKLEISVGICVFPDHGSTPDDLLAAADRALYEAKARGKHRIYAAGKHDPIQRQADSQAGPQADSGFGPQADRQTELSGDVAPPVEPPIGSSSQPPVGSPIEPPSEPPLEPRIVPSTYPSAEPRIDPRTDPRTDPRIRTPVAVGFDETGAVPRTVWVGNELHVISEVLLHERDDGGARSKGLRGGGVPGARLVPGEKATRRIGSGERLEVRTAGGRRLRLRRLEGRWYLVERA